VQNPMRASTFPTPQRGSLQSDLARGQAQAMRRNTRQLLMQEWHLLPPALLLVWQLRGQTPPVRTCQRFGGASSLWCTLVGAGGGTVVTPMLALLTGLPQATVLGTSLLAMIPPSIVGLVQHQRLGNVDWRMAAGTELRWLPGGRDAWHHVGAFTRSGSYVARSVWEPVRNYAHASHPGNVSVGRACGKNAGICALCVLLDINGASVCGTLRPRSRHDDWQPCGQQCGSPSSSGVSRGRLFCGNGIFGQEDSSVRSEKVKRLVQPSHRELIIANNKIAPTQNSYSFFSSLFSSRVSTATGEQILTRFPSGSRT
jgi:Sulfite exporter TauE/SafE